jgi:Uma2 family endonuclease
MTQPPRRRATYEDLLAVPDTKVAEILDGELHVSPRPALPHAFAHSNLLTDLNASLRGSGPGSPPGGGWWFLTEPELHFGEDVLVPDIAAWRRERLPVVPNDAFLTLAPDWLCEVVSPSTARLDRAGKLPIYAREGIAHVWIVDPLARTLEAYRLESGGWLLVATHQGVALVRCEPFDAVELDLARWWLPEEAAPACATP